jgi:hypothetical protein
MTFRVKPVLALALVSAVVGCSEQGATREQMERLQKSHDELAKSVAALTEEVRALPKPNPMPIPAATQAPVAESAIARPALKFGTLSLTTTPPTAMASTVVEGKPWMRTTPLEDVQLPVGEYTIVIRNEGLGWQKTVKVQIREGKRHILENVRLSPKE